MKPSVVGSSYELQDVLNVHAVPDLMTDTTGLATRPLGIQDLELKYLDPSNRLWSYLVALHA
jgi:hypothetical protein